MSRFAELRTTVLSPVIRSKLYLIHIDALEVGCAEAIFRRQLDMIHRTHTLIVTGRIRKPCQATAHPLLIDHLKSDCIQGNGIRPQLESPCHAGAFA